MPRARSNRSRRLAAVALPLLAGALAAGPARADGTAPDYPGSTLHVSVTGPLEAFHALNIVATGSNVAQTSLGGPALDFGLELFVVNPKVLSGPCATSEEAELNAVTDVPTGGRLLTFDDLNEGPGGPFTISEPFEPGGSGPLQVCAYSMYVTDDAAWAQANVTIAPATKAPSSTGRPSVHRSGRSLLCRRGSWSGSPTRFRYRWRVGRGRLGAAHRSDRLRITSRLRGRSVACSVSATNATGSARATSRPVRVR